MSQSQIDARNAAFWNELCGTGLAQSLGLSSDDPDALAKFDTAYMSLYPYLAGYVDRFDLSGRVVLEIGLGYGTLAQCIAARGATYCGVDIAAGPVSMVRHRLELLGAPAEGVVQGSALELPFDDGSFDLVYSIGCLHHTGDIARAVAEVRRVLRDGGSAVVMLYNRHSFRQLVRVPLARLRRTLNSEDVRALYDTDTHGDAAPHTDYVSRADVRRLFSAFDQLEVKARNFDPLTLRGRVLVPRERLLGSVDRLLGLDLYIVVRKNLALP